MTRIAELTKTLTETKPLMAYVGVADLAVERAREARVGAEARRASYRAEAKARRARIQAAYAPATLQAKASELPTQAVKAVKVVTDVAGQAQELPALALNRGLELVGQAQARYEDLAVRGEKLVKRVRNQQATKDLVDQTDATVALGKGAVTSARKTAAEVERSTKALVTTGRTQATRAADAISDSVADEAAVVKAEVRKSAKATRTAAKRTSTTTKKAAARTRNTTKATTTSVRKTVAGATKAAEKAAAKVGA